MSRIWNGSIGRNGRNAAATRDAEHVPEVRRRAHQHVLDGVGEDAAAFGDAVGEHAEILFEQDDVGRVLGDVGGGVDRDADVGVVQGERVVDAVAEERDGGPCVAAGRVRRGLLLRADPGEDRRPWYGGGELLRRRAASSSLPVRVPVDVEPELSADGLGDERVVAGDDLDRDAQSGEPGDRRGRGRLGLVEEDEEAGEVQIVLVVDR